MGQQFDFKELVLLCRQTHEVIQQRAARSVNIELVVRNWLFGWYIVEFENGDGNRADIYGKKLVDQLSKTLLERGLKGISPTNLRKCREFYVAYQKIQQTVSAGSFSIGQAVSGELISLLTSQFKLGWSHYVNLLSISDSKYQLYLPSKEELKQQVRLAAETFEQKDL